MSKTINHRIQIYNYSYFQVDTAKINLQMLQDAHKFGIHGLKELCSRYLIDEIGTDDSVDVVDVLVVADELSDQDLKEAAKNFIVENNLNLDKLEGNAKLLMEVARTFKYNFYGEE